MSYVSSAAEPGAFQAAAAVFQSHAHVHVLWCSRYIIIHTENRVSVNSSAAVAMTSVLARA